MSPSAFFLDVDGSQRFCILHRPQMEVRGTILYLHPFAEEMNRSRHVAALQARAFAAAGYAVLQMDLHGCGDSAGDFADATWTQWLADVRAGVRYLQESFERPLCLWGFRSGALLATAIAREVSAKLLLWQPVTSGHQHLQQFLRLSLAANMLDGGRASGSTEALRAQLTAGQCVEVAGYSISPELAHGLATAELQFEGLLGHCIEIQPGGGEISPALHRLLHAGSTRASVCVDSQCWLTPAIMACPELMRASLEAMESLLP